MTRRAFTQAYRRVRLWIRRHGAWPAERDVRACDRLAFECLYARQVAAPGELVERWDAGDRDGPASVIFECS